MENNFPNPNVVHKTNGAKIVRYKVDKLVLFEVTQSAKGRMTCVLKIGKRVVLRFKPSLGGDEFAWSLDGKYALHLAKKREKLLKELEKE